MASKELYIVLIKLFLVHGYKGVCDLQNGITAFSTCEQTSVTVPDINVLSSCQEMQKFPMPIFSNCLPHIDVFLENGYTKEEEKMIKETRKILKNPQLKITATTVRVPVFNCHSESINVELEKDFELSKLKHVLASAPGIIVKDDSENAVYPTVLDTNNQDATYVRTYS